MRYNKGIFVLYLLLLCSLLTGAFTPLFGQRGTRTTKKVPASFCLTEAEMRLYQLVAEYRKSKGLPSIPLSKSLCYVARLHLKDLFLHPPDEDGSCNFHSWSSSGNWKPFCYPADENKKNSVWDKPKEITSYPGKGYEIIYWENSPVLADTILSVWKTEPYFNSFLTNSGKWQGVKWNALGLAIYENWACAWFGELPDPDEKVFVCGNPPAPVVAKTPKVKPLPEKTEKKTTPVAIDSIPNAFTFYIIVRTNISKENALKLVEKFRQEGYPGAEFLDRDGKSRVSVLHTTDRAEVMAKLREVKKTYKDAWIYKVSP